MQVHPVFNVSLLELAVQDPLLGQRQTPPPPLEINGEQEWVVDSILDSQMCQNKVASGDEEASGHERPEVESGDEEASRHD